MIMGTRRGSDKRRGARRVVTPLETWSLMGVRRLAIALAVAAVAPPAARAQACPAPAGAGPQLEAAAPEARLAFIRSRMRAEAGRVRTWQLGWSIGYGTLAAGQLAAIPFTQDPGSRADWAVGAGSAAVGFGLVLLFPPEVRSDEPRLASLPADGCAALAEAERLLAKDAANEAQLTGWLVHAGNVVLNAGFGLILGLGYQRWGPAALTFATGAALGEATIFTQPTRLAEDLERYRQGDLASGEAAAVRVVPVLAPGGFGLAVAGTF